MSPQANSVARAVIAQFHRLPPKRKPCVRDNGVHEWVPLSGIVAQVDGQFICLSLATGMKCLPASKLAMANGNILHDWHAEVLAIRALNRLLLDECDRVRRGVKGAGLVEWCENAGCQQSCHRPFKIKPGIRLHMYCSEAPCGDASMELTMAAQRDASAWDLPRDAQSLNPCLPGRLYFSQLGIVRRKPARGDAPETLSKSCSDKLSLKQCTSLLSSLTSLFIDPTNAYIDLLVLPESQHSAQGCQRAFGNTGRMSPLTGAAWPEAYAFRPFTIVTTTEEFDFSRQALQARVDAISGSNLSSSWFLPDITESIIGGVQMGKKQFDPSGATLLSRRQMWTLSVQLAASLETCNDIKASLKLPSYHQVKQGPLLATRAVVKADTCKAALATWPRNEGDSHFALDKQI
ncbi:hypothetical protein CDD81_5742 [Ophiocordyceps australis]|uniref:A to I editase domain-containing protein n=1 Tax=Ophiocordyceps australis TaxID=1399860 RepID=A0A2C5Y235_9HYPO|nr:hypothetical protein CDD81_5742 [Ophiocordyceps australis]